MSLEPGDRLLRYTDGVVEACAADGNLFGLHRLADTIIRTTAAGITAPEALRRLVHGLLAEHADRLTDHAAIMLVEQSGTGLGNPAHAEGVGSNHRLRPSLYYSKKLVGG